MIVRFFINIIFILMLINARLLCAEGYSVLARSSYLEDGGRIEAVESKDSKTTTEVIWDKNNTKIKKIVYERDLANKIRIARVFIFKKNKPVFHRFVLFGYNRLGKKSEERMYGIFNKKKTLVHWVYFFYSRGKQRKPTVIYLLDDSGKVVVNKTKEMKKYLASMTKVKK